MSTDDSTIEDDKKSALAEFQSMMREGLNMEKKAYAALEAAIPEIVAVIQMRCGSSYRLARLVWSCWNGQNLVGLCNDLSGFDIKNQRNVLALLNARLVLGGNADKLIRAILEKSGEFRRFEEQARATPDDRYVPYPLPQAAPDYLREMAAAIEKNDHQ